jgi:hypothetical protein
LAYLSQSVLHCRFRHNQNLPQGKVEFTISYPELSGEMKQMEGMLPHEMIVYFKDEKSRTEMPGTMIGQAVTISNSKTNELLVMMDMMGKKIAMKQTAADLEKLKTDAAKEGMIPVVKITKVDGTKTIAGYPCKKAIIEITEGGQTQKSECYYTEKIPKLKDQNEVYFKDINGFMMEYSVAQAGVKMTVAVKTVTEQKVPDNMFVLAEGYQVMTQEELEKMMAPVGE